MIFEKKQKKNKEESSTEYVFLLSFCETSNEKIYEESKNQKVTKTRSYFLFSFS